MLMSEDSGRRIMRKEKQTALRYAAGVYWLLDMEQKGSDYHRPVMLNECGACIWERHIAGDTEQEIVEWMKNEYGISPEQAKDDVSRFMEQLRKQGFWAE